MLIQIRKNIQFRYLKKFCGNKHVGLLLIGEEDKRHYVLIKDFNTFMYAYTLHSGRKHFCCYYLQAFSTEEILKCHFKDCLKINGTQRVILPKKGEYANEKMSAFLIYAD